MFYQMGHFISFLLQFQMRVSLLILLFSLFLFSFNQAVSSSLTSYSTLASSVTYTLSLTFASRSIPASSQAIVLFSTNFNINSSTISSCVFLTNSGSSYSSAVTCTPTSNSSNTIITFTGIYTSTAAAQTSLSLKFQISNPLAAISQPYTFYIASGGTNVTSSSNTISFTASSLAGCSSISSSVVNGNTATRTISFTPSVPVISGSFLTITQPIWFNSLSSLSSSNVTCVTVSNLDVSNPVCTVSTSGGNQIYRVANLFASNKTVTGAVSFNISTLYNPWSTYPYGPISFSLIFGASTTQSCSGVFQATTTMNTLNSFNIGLLLSISTPSNNRTGWLKNTNPFPASGGQLNVSWSSGVSISYTSTGVAPFLVGLGTNSLVVGNFSSNSNPNSNISLPNRFNMAAPKSSRSFTITFTTYYFLSGTAYGIETRTNTFTVSAGVLSPVSVSVANSSINKNTTLLLSITLGNPIQAGSFIGVTFPQYLTAIVGSTCSTNSTLVSCSVTANNFSNLSVSGTVAAASKITITYNTITTAQEALTTNSISVKTYIDAANDGIVDQVSSGLNLTFTSNQIAPSTFFISPANKTTYITTSYTFSVDLNDPIPSNGYIILTFPSPITLTSPSLLSASFSTGSCSLNQSGSNLTLAGCFPSGLSVLSVFITIGGVNNPKSLAPSASFQLFTYGTISLVNLISSGPSVTMNSLAQSTAFSVVQSPTTVHATATYTFQITFFGSHTSSDYLIFNLPSTMSYAATPVCTPTSGIASMNCTVINSTILKIVLVANPAFSIVFTVSNIVNYDISNTLVSLSMTAYNSAGYASQQTPTYQVSFTSTTLLASVVQNNGIVQNKASNITIKITTPFALSSSLSSSLTSLTIVLPSELQILANSSCSLTGLTCSLSSSTFVVNNIGLSVVNVEITLFNILVPALSGSIGSFTVKYLYNGSLVAQATSGVTLSAYCTSPCQKCSSSPSLCLSCLPAPNALILFYAANSSCLSSCPPATFQSNTTCASCVPPCLLCTALSTCSSCVSTSLFYSPNNSCVGSCPNGYFNKSGNCSVCLSPCATCTTNTSCLSCSTDYYYNSSCLPASSCPNGTYPNATARLCASCSSQCATCNQSTSCLSCANTYFFYNATCINSCPNGTYMSGSNCFACSGSCLTCKTTATNCLSCPSNLVLSLLQCISSCPNGTYNSSGVCSSCSSICRTCSSSSICTSCSEPYFFTSNSCSLTCPSNSYADSSTGSCNSCAGSCLGCSLTALNCTSCSSFLILYNNTCTSSCPTNYFNVSGSCQTCSNCNQCLSVSACSVCQSGYYLYSGKCYATCPTTAPEPDLALMTCTQCGNTCSACSADAGYCTSCNSGYLILSGKCYSACPSGYNANYTSSSCIATKVVAPNYYPCSIAVGVTLLMAGLSKLLHPVTDFVGNSLAMVSLGCIASGFVLLLGCLTDQTLPARLLMTVSVNQSILVILSIGAIGVSVALGLTFVIYLCCKLNGDAGLTLWRQRYRTNRYILNICLIFTCFRVGIMRMSYSQMFGRECFSCFVYAHGFFLKVTNFFSIVSILLCSIPTIAVSLLIITGSLGVTQTQIYAIDCLALASLQTTLLVIDMCVKSKQHFKSILKYLPYLRKFKRYREQESSDGSLISLQQHEDARPKTEASHDSNILVHNFGVFSEEQNSEAKKSIVKTLPQHNSLNAEVTFDPYEQKKMSDDLFFHERQYTRKFNQLKQQVQVQQQENQGQTQMQNFFELRRSPHSIINQPDKTVKQIINEIPREIDPAKYLSNISSQQFKQVTEVQMKELDRLAEKHQVDPALMRQLFGIRKNHNPKLLNDVLDHQEQAVPSQAVQQLINSKNNQQKLQDVFGRDSLVQAHKIRQILRDPDSKILLRKLFDEEISFFLKQTIKRLLSTSFTTEFIKNLLSSQNIDGSKLKILLNNNEKSQIEGLNALKQLGGQNLERKERIKNIIGSDSVLDPSVIPKIASEMSESSTSTIFDKQTNASKTLVKKIVNNKKIYLQPLNPIQQMPEIVQEFAELLNCGNEKVQSDLIEMLENGNYEGEALKEMVLNAGSSQQQMAKLLSYIEQKNRKDTPIEDWPQNLPQFQQEEEEQEDSNYLDFDLEKNQAHQNPIPSPIQEQFIEETGRMRTGVKTKMRKKELPQIHLPSQPIYLQRIQGAHQVQKNKNIRKKRRKVQRQADKFMDEDNQIYDLNF